MKKTGELNKELELKELENEPSEGVSGKQLLIAHTLNVIWKIQKLNPDDAYRYVSDKLEKEKETVSIKEYKMAEKGSERRAGRISSASFLDSPLHENVALFKKFLTLEIIKQIKKIKKDKWLDLKVVSIFCDNLLPMPVGNAAKKSNIDPKSISAEKSGVMIYLEPAKAVYKDWLEKPRERFDLK